VNLLAGFVGNVYAHHVYMLISVINVCAWVRHIDVVFLMGTTRF